MVSYRVLLFLTVAFQWLPSQLSFYSSLYCLSCYSLISHLFSLVFLSFLFRTFSSFGLLMLQLNTQLSEIRNVLWLASNIGQWSRSVKVEQDKATISRHISIEVCLGLFSKQLSSLVIIKSVHFLMYLHLVSCTSTIISSCTLSHVFLRGFVMISKEITCLILSCYFLDGLASVNVFASGDLCSCICTCSNTCVIRILFSCHLVMK
jgi:hypothetical protein